MNKHYLVEVYHDSGRCHAYYHASSISLSAYTVGPTADYYRTEYPTKAEALRHLPTLKEEVKNA